jgi:hypothetical protein
MTYLPGFPYAIADHLGLTEGQDPELEQLKKEVSPEHVLQEMEKKERESA